MVHVLASQAAWPDGPGVTIMDYDGSGLAEGVANPIAAGHKAADDEDALAIAPYFGGKITSEQVLANDVDQLLDKLEVHIDSHLGPDGWIGKNVRYARARGLDTVAYECGQHLATETRTKYVRSTASAGGPDTITLPDSWNTSGEDDYYNGRVITITAGPGAGQTRTITDYDGAGRTVTVDSAWSEPPTSSSKYLIRLLQHHRQDEVNRHDRMEELYLRMLNGWRDIGLDENGRGCKLWCQFNDVYHYSHDGPWGMLEYFDQDRATAPKWRALTGFIADNARWWGEP